MCRSSFRSDRACRQLRDRAAAATVFTILGLVAAFALTVLSPFVPRADAAAPPPLATPPVGIARTPDGGGYWITTSDGSIANYGTAGFFNSLPGLGVRVSNIVGIAPTPTGRGYWLVGADGGVFALGDAPYANSLPGLGVHLNAPVVGITPTPSGGGYWLVAKDGGVFAFGDARFLGRPEVVNRPVQSGRTVPGNLTLSATGADFVAAHEGFSAKGYNDANNHCTVGFGHLLHLGRCSAAELDTTMSRATATSLLQADTRSFQNAIRDAVPGTPLYQHEFDALVDFTYNVGSGAFAGSSVRSHLAAAPPNYGAVPSDFAKWNADNLCGLYRRRIDEGNLFRSASYSRTSVACPAGMR